jgi:hypothetical protein
VNLELLIESQFQTIQKRSCACGQRSALTGTALRAHRKVPFGPYSDDPVSSPRPQGIEIGPILIAEEHKFSDTAGLPHITAKTLRGNTPKMEVLMEIVAACWAVVPEVVQIFGVRDDEEHPVARDSDHLGKTGLVMSCREMFDNVNGSNQVEGTVAKGKKGQAPLQSGEAPGLLQRCP